MSKGLLVLMAIALGASACAKPSPFVDQVREPRQQAFNPPYPEEARARDLVALMDAALSQDQRSLTVTFIGGKGYLATDPCSEDYVPWVGLNGEVLEVAIARVHPPEMVKPGGDVICTLEGYEHTYLLHLGETFDGTTVDDLAGGSLWVAPPAGLAELRGLPAEWELVDEFDEPTASPSLWGRVYRKPGAALGRAGQAGGVFFYQAFDGRTQIGGGDDIRQVEVNGRAERILRSPDFGELILQWDIGGIGLALVVNEADFSIEELVELAESAELTPD